MYCYKSFGQISYISPLESETRFCIMRKSLLLVALSVSTLFSNAQEQALFEAPDTVCVNQPVQLKSNVPNKQSHYWGFCSGYLYNDPTGENLGDVFSFDAPSSIEVGRDDDGNYYGFVTSRGTSGAPARFTRLDYGESLDNTPTITDFGTMDDILPENPNSMHLVRDLVDSNWYIFLTAGTTPSTSNFARIDFGNSLGNTPNIVSFGNIDNKLADPTGIFVAKAEENGNWYGFAFNRASNNFLRFDFGDNISLTPSVVNINTVGDPFSRPNNIAPIKENGKWYFFVTNENNLVNRLDMDSLTNPTPTSNDISGVFNTTLDVPTGITFVKDCDRIHGFIVNRGSHDVLRLEMNDVEGPYTFTNFNNIGGTLSPTDISRVIRDRDNVYAFIPNQSDQTLTQVKFAQCTRTNITSSLSSTPPPYRYDTAGLYNLYYAVNEGMPDAQVMCKQIRVLAIPPMIVTPDTIICQGDTATLQVLSINARSFTWSPNYNISNISKNLVKVWPEYTNRYRVRMPFPFGSCVVDTSINVEVRKVEADAGPDRSIADGASTILGGPNTDNNDHSYLRVWSPNQYIDDIYSDHPVVRPPSDFTYYITVTDTSTDLLPKQCSVTDTVIVFVSCDDMNLPNAFMPESTGPRARFGLLNSQIIKLDRFNIYDRWGKQVFTTTDPTKQWDGNINGEKAAVGVYVWEAVGFCSSGKLIQKTGNVTLIR